MNHGKKGFSIVLAIIIIAFLTIISAGVLDLVARDQRIATAHWRGMAAQAGAEGAVEWALLKAKGHGAGFEDAVKFGESDEARVLANKASDTDFGSSDQTMEYEISARSSDYFGRIEPHSFDIIPLFHDPSGKDITGAAAFEWTGGLAEIRKLEVTEFKNLANGQDAKIVWNVVGTRALEKDGKPSTSHETDGIAGDAPFFNASEAVNREAIQDATSGLDYQRISVDSKSKVGDFLNRHDAKYLVMFNYNGFPASYRVKVPGNALSLPDAEIVGYSSVGGYRRALRVVNSNRGLFSALKYSMFSAQ